MISELDRTAEGRIILFTSVAVHYKYDKAELKTNTVSHSIQSRDKNSCTA